MRVVGENGSIDIDANIFWTVFNARSPGNLFIGPNFWTVEYDNDSASWDFYSHGDWMSHRVGLCQYGSYGRAEAGEPFNEILSHYYHGTEIRSVNVGNIRVGLTKIPKSTVSIRVNGTYILSTDTGISTQLQTSDVVRIIPL